jgi:hypothetical protein
MEGTMTGTTINKTAAVCAGALALLIWAAIPTHAAVKWVENFGVDSGTCGAGFFTPCRTITQAIQNANPLDVILVGPGIYGEFDGDGSFENPAEEPAEIGFGCNCVVKVDKRVTLLSRRGIGTAVIHYGVGDNNARIVAILASNVTMIGFSVVGGEARRLSTYSSPTGIAINDGVNNVRLILNEVEDSGIFGFILGNGSGNILSSNRASGHSVNYEISGSNDILVSNFANNAYAGFDVLGDGNRLVSNRTFNIKSIAGSGDGFFIQGSHNLLSRNVAAASQPYIWDGHGFHEPFGSGGSNTYVGNMAVANGVTGFTLETGPSLLVSNAAIGNGGCGFVSHGSNTIRASNIYANGLTDPAPAEGLTDPGYNCGLYVLSGTGTPNAIVNFWGASTGPGADPADVVSSAGGPATTTPFSTVPFP